MENFTAKDAETIANRVNNHDINKILKAIKSKAKEGFKVYLEYNEFSEEVELELINRGFKVMSQRPDGRHVGGWYRAIYWGEQETNEPAPGNFAAKLAQKVKNQ